MGRRKQAKRTPLQVSADDFSSELNRKLGQMLLDGRARQRITQDRAAELAGISRSEWSNLERGKKVATMPLWNRAAFAVGGKLRAYVEETSAATGPRVAVHLRNQELVLRTAAPGRWHGVGEAQIDPDAGRSRHADVLMERRQVGLGDEYALCEVSDWVPDVGDGVRDFQRRLAAVDRYAVARMRDDAVPRTCGFWLVRATLRNRRLVDEHRNFFHSRFPGSGRASS